LFFSNNDGIESFLSRDADELRESLLGIKGVGEETADSIILYAAKQPTFVVDTYTLRTLERLGLIPRGTGKRELRRAVMRALPADTELYAELHALLVQHGKSVCRTAPRCWECPMVDRCRHGAEIGVAGAKPVVKELGTRSYWSER